MTEARLENLDVEQLRQLARLQAEKLSELEQQLAIAQQQLVVAQALAGHAPLLASFVSTLLTPYHGVLRVSSELLAAAAPQVKWQPTGDGFVVWTERPAPPPKPEAG